MDRIILIRQRFLRRRLWSRKLNRARRRQQLATLRDWLQVCSFVALCLATFPLSMPRVCFNRLQVQHIWGLCATFVADAITLYGCLSRKLMLVVYTFELRLTATTSSISSCGGNIDISCAEEQESCFSDQYSDQRIRLGLYHYGYVMLSSHACTHTSSGDP